MRAIAFAVLAMMGYMVAACGSVREAAYEPETAYEPTSPHSAEGRVCVSQCQQTEVACQNACYDRYRRSRFEQRAYAEEKFNQYRTQRLLLKQPIKKSRRRLYGGYSRSREQFYTAGRRRDFIGCFSTCGGDAASPMPRR